MEKKIDFIDKVVDHMVSETEIYGVEVQSIPYVTAKVKIRIHLLNITDIWFTNICNMYGLTYMESKEVFKKWKNELLENEQHTNRVY